MKTLALLCLAAAILALGAEKRNTYRREVRLLRDYALSLERLKGLIAEEKCPLPQALERAGQGNAASYFLALKAQLTGSAAAQPPVEELALPLNVLGSADSQARVLNALIQEVNGRRQELEQRLPMRIRSAMTFSCALAALVVIVLM